MLQFINHPEGYVEPLYTLPKPGSGQSPTLVGTQYVYQYKDHLGNIRLSYADNDNDGKIDVVRNATDVDGDGDNAMEIREEKNYYPFGLTHKGYNDLTRGRPHNYGYNGVEEENELGLNMLSMDLRKYDPAIARWTGIDPVTHHSMSPYNAFDNNPVYFADPSGADGEPFNWQFGKYGNDGLIHHYNSSGEQTGTTDPKKKKAQDSKKKYQTYNVVPFDNLYVNNNVDQFTFNMETGYGEDPTDLHASKADAVITLLQNLDDNGKIKLLRSLGVGLKVATKFLDKLAILDANPMSIYNDGLAALPGIGTIVGLYSDQFKSEQRGIENEVKWDNVRSSFNDLMDQSDLTNVILIYTNDNLFEKNTVSGSDMEILQDRNPTQDYKHIYYGAYSC